MLLFSTFILLFSPPFFFFSLPQGMKQIFLQCSLVEIQKNQNKLFLAGEGNMDGCLAETFYFALLIS